MKTAEAKQKFIDSWGTLGSKWGINKSMAQVHALMLSESDDLSTEQVMEMLHISRGNANMSIRALIDWGLVYKAFKQGDRKEYFKAEKDIWVISQQILRERRRRELDPLIRVLSELKGCEAESKEDKEFVKTMKEIESFATRTDKLMDKAINADKNWFTRKLFGLG